MPQPDALPQSIEAEQSVLGGLLLDGAAIDRIADLKPHHFSRSEHRTIFQAMLDCAEDDGVIDLTTVADRLQRNGSAGDGITAYLGSLA